MVNRYTKSWFTIRNTPKPNADLCRVLKQRRDETIRTGIGSIETH